MGITRASRVAFRFLQAAWRDGPTRAVRQILDDVQRRVLQPVMERQHNLDAENATLRVIVADLRQRVEDQRTQWGDVREQCAALEMIARMANDRAATLEDHVRHEGEQFQSVAEQCLSAQQRADVLERVVEKLQEIILSGPNNKVLQLHSDSIQWLAERLTAAETPPIGDASPRSRPLVSVIMPVRNRQHSVARAIDSVRAQSFSDWELIVVDDGSTDATRDVLREYAGDARIRPFYRCHTGAAASRNFALEESRGDIIAYLDSDNVWYPGALASFAKALQEREDGEHAGADSAYFALIWNEVFPPAISVRCAPFDFAALFEMRMGIDLNAFAHKRRLYEQLGGFDTSLTRLMDWDLILRYTARSAPQQLPIVGGLYYAALPDSISTKESFYRNRHLVQRKFERSLERPFGVLLVLGEDQSPDDALVAVELAYLQRRGVEVEVWQATGDATGQSATASALRETIERFRPGLMHVHGLSIVAIARQEAARAAIPVTVCAGDDEFLSVTAAASLVDATIQRLYLNGPEWAEPADESAEIRQRPITFDERRYPPAQAKDPLLVVCRASDDGAELREFVAKLAADCPEQRFVLLTSGEEAGAECPNDDATETGATPRNLQVLHNLAASEQARFVTSGGMYLVAPATVRSGMGAPIVEALATGAYVIAPFYAATTTVIGDAGACYESRDEVAALIGATSTWSPEQWRQARVAAIDRAYRHHVDSVALEPLLADWLGIVETGAVVAQTRLKIASA